jgi:hypothetical protein
MISQQCRRLYVLVAVTNSQDQSPFWGPNNLSPYRSISSFMETKEIKPANDPYPEEDHSSPHPTKLVVLGPF